MSLPTTTNPSDPQAGSQPQQPSPTGMLMTIAGRVKEYATGALKTRKPWVEVFDRNSFAKPANMSEAASRIRKNASYFRVNYLIVMVLLLVVSFALHPKSLFMLAVLLGAWVYLFVIKQTPLVIGGRTFSEREKLIGMSVISLVVFFYSNVGTIAFSAALLGAIIVALHGATRVPDDLFQDEAEAPGAGLLGMFTIPATTTGPGNV